MKIQKLSDHLNEYFFSEHYYSKNKYDESRIKTRIDDIELKTGLNDVLDLNKDKIEKYVKRVVKSIATVHLDKMTNTIDDYKKIFGVVLGTFKVKIDSKTYTPVFTADKNTMGNTWWVIVKEGDVATILLGKDSISDDDILSKIVDHEKRTLSDNKYIKDPIELINTIFIKNIDDKNTRNIVLIDLDLPYEELEKIYQIGDISINNPELMNKEFLDQIKKEKEQNKKQLTADKNSILNTAKYSTIPSPKNREMGLKIGQIIYYMSKFDGVKSGKIINFLNKDGIDINTKTLVPGKEIPSLKVVVEKEDKNKAIVIYESNNEDNKLICQQNGNIYLSPVGKIYRYHHDTGNNLKFIVVAAKLFTEDQIYKFVDDYTFDVSMFSKEKV